MTPPSSPRLNGRQGGSAIARGLHNPEDPRPQADDADRLPVLVDTETVAGALGVSVRHVRRLVTERRIPFVKVGYFVRFDPAAVSAWVDAHRVEIADRSEAKGQT